MTSSSTAELRFKLIPCLVQQATAALQGLEALLWSQAVLHEDLGLQKLPKVVLIVHFVIGLLGGNLACGNDIRRELHLGLLLLLRALSDLGLLRDLGWLRACNLGLLRDLCDLHRSLGLLRNLGLFR